MNETEVILEKKLPYLYCHTTVVERTDKMLDLGFEWQQQLGYLTSHRYLALHRYLKSNTVQHGSCFGL